MSGSQAHEEGSRRAVSAAGPLMLRQRLIGADPAEADRWMRGAVEWLLRVQAEQDEHAGRSGQAEQAGQAEQSGRIGPAGEAVCPLESPLARVADAAPPPCPAVAPAPWDAFARRAAGGDPAALGAGWPVVKAALRREAEDQPQGRWSWDFSLGALRADRPYESEWALQGGAMPWQPLTTGIAALLRDGALAFDEEREIDWAIRWWSGARRAGLLGEHALAGDFGLCWRAIEWSSVRLHLAALGEPGHPLAAGEGWQSRLCAQLVRSATRYRELAPLVPLVERLAGPLTQTGFNLR